METRIVKLKSEFNNIITIRNNVKSIFDFLFVKIGKLKFFYSELIKDRKSEMFVFGLDSFYFQSKLIDIEYDDMKRLFLAINNRMYCEYFKLHKIITDYISKNVIDKKVIDMIKIIEYPVYKDLEPFKEYNIELISEIHESILNFLNVLISLLNNRENELQIHKTKQNIGLNIDNFITTFNFNITVLREKILMFITYIEFFHKTHTKYLKRFNNKIQLMHTHIMHDINFDESLEQNNDSKQDNIEDYEIINNIQNTTNNLETSSENGENYNYDIRSKTSSIDIVDNNINSDNSNIILIKAEIDNNSNATNSNNPDIPPHEIIDNTGSICNTIIETVKDTVNNKEEEQKNLAIEENSVVGDDESVNEEPIKEEPVAKKKRTYKPRNKKI
jgi:hypothetical protein